MNYTRFVLSGTFHEIGRQTKGLSSAAGSDGFRFDQFYLKVDSIIKKKSVGKILIECRLDFTAGIFAGLEEIRERIEALKAGGKEVYFYAPSYNVQQLYLASACSYRLIHPMGTLRFSGLSQSFSFAKQLMRRFGIDAEVIRRGRFKSAGDKFRSDKLDEFNREQYEHFLCSVMDSLRGGVESGYEKTADDVDDLLNGRILTADEAADASWIDEIVTVSEFVERWKDNKDKEFKFKKIPERSRNGFSFRPRQIAVLVFEGAVIDGHTKRDPLMGQAIGSDSFIPQIRKLRDDKKVKAVVFRINSGGGSAFASEDITSELRLLAAKKPLIVSMSEVAGSGGYWMSCCGRKTFALPTTLTGSIGVLSIYLSINKLLDNIGITHDTIKQGEYADTGSALRSLTEKERSMIDSEIENMYSGFVKMISEFRKLPLEKVDSLGQGRVWPGVSALSHELIDAEGGLTDALNTAALEAGIKKPVIRFYPEVHHGLVERLVMNMSKEDEESLAAAARVNAWTKLLKPSNLNTGALAIMEEVLFKWD